MSGSIHDQLLEKCHEERLDEDAILDLLDNGADAGYKWKSDGTWGAYEAKSPINGVVSAMSRALSDEDAAGYRVGICILEALLRKGADVNAEVASYDWRGCGRKTSALHQGTDLAIRHSKPDLLGVLMRFGGNPSARNRQDVHSMRTDGFRAQPLLNRACEAGSLPCVEVLLEHGADPSAMTEERMNNERGYNSNTKQTAIHAILTSHAARDDCPLLLTICAKLLKANADPNVPSTWLAQRDIPGIVTPTDDPRDDEYVCPVECVPQVCPPLHAAPFPPLAALLYVWGADPSRPRMDGKVPSFLKTPLVATPDLLPHLPPAASVPEGPLGQRPPMDGCQVCPSMSQDSGSISTCCARCAFGLEPLALGVTEKERAELQRVGEEDAALRERERLEREAEAEAAKKKALAKAAGSAASKGKAAPKCKAMSRKKKA